MGIVRFTLDPADTTKTTLQGLVSPTPYLNGYGNNVNLDCSDTELQLELHEHAFALGLCYYKIGVNTLDPFGYAEKRGDGKNQYAFNAASNILIPAAIKLNGAQGDVLPADTYWLIHSNQIGVVADLPFATHPSFSFGTLTDPTIIVPQTTSNGNLLPGLSSSWPARSELRSCQSHGPGESHRQTSDY